MKRMMAVERHALRQRDVDGLHQRWLNDLLIDRYQFC